VRLSVVIPALNEERHLGQLLSDIQRQSQRPDEVIVVDAGSRDATVRIVKHSSTAPLRGQAEGFSICIGPVLWRCVSLCTPGPRARQGFT
jgi:GT2 family glycosyltransferase